MLTNVMVIKKACSILILAKDFGIEKYSVAALYAGKKEWLFI